MKRTVCLFVFVIILSNVVVADIRQKEYSPIDKLVNFVLKYFSGTKYEIAGSLYYTQGDKGYIDWDAYGANDANSCSNGYLSGCLYPSFSANKDTWNWEFTSQQNLLNCALTVKETDKVCIKCNINPTKLSQCCSDNEWSLSKCPNHILGGGRVFANIQTDCLTKGCDYCMTPYECNYMGCRWCSGSVMRCVGSTDNFQCCPGDVRSVRCEGNYAKRDNCVNGLYQPYEEFCTNGCSAGNCLGVPPPVCGNNICDMGETSENCLKDCPKKPVCGDSNCDVGETSENCLKDCPLPVNRECEVNSDCINKCVDNVLYKEGMCMSYECKYVTEICDEGCEGNTCAKPYLDLVFVAVGFGDTTNEREYFEGASMRTVNFLKQQSPFKDCQNKRVRINYVYPNECKDMCTSLCGDCQLTVLNCVRNKFNNNEWDKAVGLIRDLPTGSCVTVGGDISCLIGCASGIPSTTSITLRSYAPNVVVHEMGHQFGLCHECGLARPSICPNSDLNDSKYIMCYDTQEYFSSESYSYLKTNVFNEYLERC